MGVWNVFNVFVTSKIRRLLKNTPIFLPKKPIFMPKFQKHKNRSIFGKIGFLSQKIAKNRLFWENKHTFLSKNRSITDTSNTDMCDVYTIYVICNTSRLFLSLPRFYRHTREFVRKKSVNLAKNRLFEKKSTEKSAFCNKNLCENCEKSACTKTLKTMYLNTFM